MQQTTRCFKMFEVLEISQNLRISSDKPFHLAIFQNKVVKHLGDASSKKAFFADFVTFEKSLKCCKSHKLKT